MRRFGWIGRIWMHRCDTSRQEKVRSKEKKKLVQKMINQMIVFHTFT